MLPEDESPLITLGGSGSRLIGGLTSYSFLFPLFYAFPFDPWSK
jgi:hypothetical protein